MTKKTTAPAKPKPFAKPRKPLNDPPALPATVTLSDEVRGILAFVNKEEAGERDRLRGLEELAKNQEAALKGTQAEIQRSRREIEMILGTRFGVIEGAKMHHGLNDSYTLRPDGSLSCLPG